jgi:predicted Zn finger-like uncharacterized protein
MQVTCPSCSARYAVDPRAIGPTGRTVQCVRCSRRWFERPPVVEATVPPPRPIPDVVIRPAPFAASYTASLPALAAPPPRSTWGWWLGGLAAIVVVIALVGWALRHEILQLMPPELKASLPLDMLRLAFRS